MSKKAHVSNTVSRRSVLKTILYTPPALMFTAGGLFAERPVGPIFKPRLIPKGQRIRAAQIGVFNRGAQVLETFKQYSKDQIEFKAFADVAFTSHDASMQGFDGVPCYRDYRQMLEEMHAEIDAVIISTPDHAHFPMAMHAMLLGKHVYVEKPMAQNVYESRLLAKAAKACDVITQMGNQGHSGSGTFQFAKWVEEGLIKNVRKIDAWMTSSRRWHGWTFTEYPQDIPPVGYDWDQWLCGRPFRPYSDKLIGGNWRCWYDFGCGAMGDWGAHVLDAMHRYLELGQPYEISTELIGPSDLYYPQGSIITFKFKARKGMPPLELRWFDGQGNTPPAPKGYTGGMGNVGSIIYGEDYTIKGGSHGAAYNIIIDEKAMELQRTGKLPKPPSNLSNHYKNFLNACQDIEPVNSPFEVSAQLTELLCLGCIGQRFGGTLKYDAEAMKITNHPEADKMLRGPAVRQGWQVYNNLQPMKSKKASIKNPDNVPWEELFKDKDLSNWLNPYDFGQAEYVDGVVTLGSEKGKWFLLTREQYSNFVFEGEIKMPVGQGNSGFMFRCQHAKNRVWGYQAEVDTADRKWSGGLYDEGRRMWFASPNRDKAPSPQAAEESIAAFRARAGECFKQGQWNKYRITCIGSHIRIYVNDVLTTDIHDEMDLQGHIGIQHHGEKGLLYQFRNLRIKDLGAGGEIYYPHREQAKAAPVASKLRGDVYEAEAARMSGCTTATNHAGFQGTGFADFGEAGSYIEWDNVLADDNGVYTLTFQYAAANNRPCELLVNNRSVAKIPFASTGAWTNWKTVDVKVEMKKGPNFVRVVAIGPGPNLDAMAVNK